MILQRPPCQSLLNLKNAVCVYKEQLKTKPEEHGVLF